MPQERGLGAVSSAAFFDRVAFRDPFLREVGREVEQPDLLDTSTYLTISTKSRDIERLLRIPGPTYIIGVHEPSKRVFIRSVHTGMANKTITRIPLIYELTSANLKNLRDEVRQFWATTGHKPTSSVFA